MSTSEHSDDDAHKPPNGTSDPRPKKKRRIQTVRACDRCRLKKIRCDGVPGATCSHCAATDGSCVFTPRPKPARYIDKKYVDKLETRMHRFERLLSRLHPDEDFSQVLEHDEPPTPTSATPAPTKPSPALDSSLPGDSDPGPSLRLRQLSPPEAEAAPDSDDDSGSVEWPLARAFGNGPGDGGPGSNRFYGRSSNVHMMQTALSLRSDVPGSGEKAMQHVLSSARLRPEFWKPHPWERSRPQEPYVSPYVFPDADLQRLLVDTYFALAYPMFPVLHRPTFEADYAARRHASDDGVGAVLLLVCAIAARLCRDPRVLLDEPDAPAHPHSAGWAWFRQVQLVRNTALIDPSVYDLQIIALSTVYMSGISPTMACWSTTGIGIRMAQDVGAHRRRMYRGHTVTGELWRRAFWALLVLDVWFSAMLGRPCAISLNSIDADLPPDCDDEYWLEEDPARRFKQPPGKPSNIAYFVYLVRLNLINSHVLRTIYAPKSRKDKDASDPGRLEWSKQVVSELDAALSAWRASIPEHLRWDPHASKSETHFLQSSALHSFYRLVQITIHRPFIEPGSRGVASLAVCTDAARACIATQRAHQARRPGLVTGGAQVPTFMSAIVLLVRIFLMKRTRVRIDVDKEMKDVHYAMEFLALGESSWPFSGRMRDILLAITNASDLPRPANAQPPTAKRADDSDNEHGANAPPYSSTTPHPLLPASASFSAASDPGAPAPKEEEVEMEISTFGPPLSPRSDGLFLFDQLGHCHVRDNLKVDGEPSLSAEIFPRPRVDVGHPPPPRGQASMSPVEQSYANLVGLGATTNTSAYSELYRLQQAFDAYPTPPQAHDTHLPVAPQQPVYRGHDDTFGLPQQMGPTQAHNEPLADYFVHPHDPAVAAVWSTMPVTFRPEEWDSFLSGFMGLTGASAGDNNAFAQPFQGAPSLF